MLKFNNNKLIKLKTLGRYKNKKSFVLRRFKKNNIAWKKPRFTRYKKPALITPLTALKQRMKRIRSYLATQVKKWRVKCRFNNRSKILSNKQYKKLLRIRAKARRMCTNRLSLRRFLTRFGIRRFFNNRLKLKSQPRAQLRLPHTQHEWYNKRRRLITVQRATVIHYYSRSRTLINKYELPTTPYLYEIQLVDQRKQAFRRQWGGWKRRQNRNSMSKLKYSIRLRRKKTRPQLRAMMYAKTLTCGFTRYFNRIKGWSPPGYPVNFFKGKKKVKAIKKTKLRRRNKKRQLTYKERQHNLFLKRKLQRKLYEARRKYFLTAGIRKHVLQTLSQRTRRWRWHISWPNTRNYLKRDQKQIRTHRSSGRARRKRKFRFFSTESRRQYKKRKAARWRRRKNKWQPKRTTLGPKKDPNRVSLVITNSRSNYFFTLTSSKNSTRNIQNTIKVFSSGKLKNMKTARKRRDMKTFIRLGVQLIRFLVENQLNNLDEMKMKFNPKRQYTAMRPYAIKKILRLLKHRKIYVRMLKFQIIRPHSYRARAPKRRRK